jgi:hypothetical protein
VESKKCGLGPKNSNFRFLGTVSKIRIPPQVAGNGKEASKEKHSGEKTFIVIRNQFLLKAKVHLQM